MIPTEVSYPSTRMRRLRSDSFVRRLVREHRLTTDDLILPIFIVDQQSLYQEIDCLQGVYRCGYDQLIKECQHALSLEISCVALFPVIDDHLRSDCGSEALNPQGLVAKSIKLIKSNFSELGVIVDVALDPYTTHGHDGVLVKSSRSKKSLDSQLIVDNDQTISILAEQALLYAQIGADIVAPSDMMDGRILAIRNKLEQNNLERCKILSYAVKYSSALYQPFRAAIKVQADLGNEGKAGYQMDVANIDQALKECKLDLNEGADMLMVKPAGYYSDVISAIKTNFQVPVFGYQVSGEYAMIKAAADQNYIDEKSTVLESMICLKRSGCDGVFTYYAKDIARWIK